MKTTNIQKMLTVSVISVMLLATSCKKDKNEEPAPNNPGNPNSSELITTLKLVFIDTLTQTTSAYVFNDPDGDGGNGPTQYDSVITLTANHVYNLEIFLFDKSKSPEDTISKEVEEEGKDHMFFFTPNTVTSVTSPWTNPYTVQHSGSLTSIKYMDLDAGTTVRGIGLLTQWTCGSSTGSTKHPLTIKLKHQAGTKDGTETPGETDIELPFKLIIQ